MRWTCLSGRDQVEPHGHIEAHLMVITSGDFLTRAEGESRSGLPIIYNPPETYHQDHFLSGPCSFFSISLPICWNRHFEELKLPRDPIHCSGIPIKAVTMQLMRTAADWDADSAAIAEALCLEVIAILAPYRPNEKRMPNWLRQVLEYLNESVWDGKIETLANTVGVHPVHLARTFRRFVHCTPGEYGRLVKVERSIRLLSRTKSPLAQIALDAGFTDQSHMTHQFKRTYGLTPGAFRKLVA